MGEIRAWFLGSALMGIRYDRAIPTLVAFAVSAQLAAGPLFILVRRAMRSKE